MKAILVIDVDDVEKYHADVYRDDDKGNGYLEMSYIPFKPMPKKWKACGLYDPDVVKGWNMAIEEIEKC